MRVIISILIMVNVDHQQVMIDYAHPFRKKSLNCLYFDLSYLNINYQFYQNLLLFGKKILNMKFHA